MIGTLERLVLSGLHEKAQSQGVDLNGVENFLKFSTQVDSVALRLQAVANQLVANSTCGCNKKKGVVVKGVDEIHTTENTYGATDEVIFEGVR